MGIEEPEAQLEQPDAEQIVEDILSNKWVLYDKVDQGSGLTVDLSYGSKGLRVFTYANGRIDTHVRTIKGRERKENETTLLYSAAREIMEDFMKRIGRPAKYIFQTKNENMLEWARTKGEEVFDGWDAITFEEDEDGTEITMFTKNFKPPESKEN